MFEFGGIVRKTDSRQVVRQGVEPDIDDLLLITWYRYSPLYRTWSHLPLDREVPQPLPDHSKYLGAPVGWHNKIWMLVDVRQQAVAIL